MTIVLSQVQPFFTFYYGDKALAKVRTFAAVRPRTDLVNDIAALPYDVYSRAEAYEKVKGDNYSFLRIDRPETQFPPEYDMYSEEVYAKGRDMLLDMIDKGEFVREDKPCYYIYELIMDGRHQTGIVAASSIDDYVNGVIKKHENTRAEKEKDRINHVYTLSAQTGPIFLAYRDSATINDIVNAKKQEEALYSFTADDGITHNVWVIDDEDSIENVRNAFDSINDIYIADGHHRAASAVKVGLKKREENPGFSGDEEFNFFLSVLFPESELAILPYNRVVRNYGSFETLSDFMNALSDICEITPVDEPFQPVNKGEFGLFAEDSWYKLTIFDKYRNDDPVEGLDVSLLQTYILKPLLGIDDPRTSSDIDFVGGIRGLSELERRCHTDMKLAFSMYPTSIGELFDVADAGLLMPPKSTWFEPKLRSGIFIHEI